MTRCDGCLMIISDEVHFLQCPEDKIKVLCKRCADSHMRTCTNCKLYNQACRRGDYAGH